MGKTSHEHDHQHGDQTYRFVVVTPSSETTSNAHESNHQTDNLAQIVRVLLKKAEIPESDLERATHFTVEFISYATKRLFHDLINIGYLQEIAKKTSRIVAFQAVLFSIALRLRVDGIETVFPRSLETNLEAMRMVMAALYDSTALLTFASTYDRVIDGDDQTRESSPYATIQINPFTHESYRAGRELTEGNPTYYYQIYEKILKLCFDPKTKTAQDILSHLRTRDYNLSAYTLPIREVWALKEAGISQEDVRSLLATWADSLTFGHYATMISTELDKGTLQESRITVPTDYVGTLLSIDPPDFNQPMQPKVGEAIPAERALAFCLDKCKATIAAIHLLYILGYLPFCEEGEKLGQLCSREIPEEDQFWRVLRRCPEILRLMEFGEFTECIVDDYHDKEEDFHTGHTASAFRPGEEGRRIRTYMVETAQLLTESGFGATFDLMDELQRLIYVIILGPKDDPESRKELFGQLESLGERAMQKILAENEDDFAVKRIVEIFRLVFKACFVSSSENFDHEVLAKVAEKS